MIRPEFDIETDRPSSVARAITAAREFATSEVGSWIIVGLLVVAVAVGLLATVLVRGQPYATPAISQPRLGGDAELAPSAAAELTLAPSSLQNLSFDEARAWNDALPYSTDRVLVARPFIAPTTDVESYTRAVDCLTAAIYYEAGSETPGGQAAVAQVVLNRTRHPAYPRTVCGVVFQGSDRTTGCQFTFTCDGAISRPPSPSGWARARAVAIVAINGRVFSPVGTATHYHTDWVAPYWAPSLSKIVKIGTHIFYRWKGGWGLPTAFSGQYLGNEPVVAKMAALSEPIIIEEPVLTAELSDISTDRMSVIVEPEIQISPLPPQTAAPDVSLPAAPPVPVAAEHAAERARRQDTMIVADPLAPPSDRPGRRPRTAAPSSW